MIPHARPSIAAETPVPSRIGTLPSITNWTPAVTGLK